MNKAEQTNRVAIERLLLALLSRLHIPKSTSENSVKWNSGLQFLTSLSNLISIFLQYGKCIKLNEEYRLAPLMWNRRGNLHSHGMGADGIVVPQRAWSY